MKYSAELSFETGPAPPTIQIIGPGSVALVTGLFAVLTRFRAYDTDFQARKCKLQVTKVKPDGSVVQSTRSSAPFLKWVGRFFGVAAIVAFCAAGWASRRSYELARDGVETQDIVAKLTRIGASHRPWFQFTDRLDETRIVESNQTSNDYLAGEELRVIYSPGDPGNAGIPSALVLIPWPAYFGFLGMLFLLIWLMTRNQLRSIGPTVK